MNPRGSSYGQQLRLDQREAGFKALDAVFKTRLEKGMSVGPHVQDMIGNIAKLEGLGCQLDLELATEAILESLHDGYASFKMIYHMNYLRHPLGVLRSMLVAAERDIGVEPRKENLKVKKGKGFKKKGSNQRKGKKVSN